MNYQKTTWKTGDLISSINLNKMEEGIEAGQEFFKVEIQPTDKPHENNFDGFGRQIDVTQYMLVTPFEDMVEAHNKEKICYIDLNGLIFFIGLVDLENSSFYTTVQKWSDDQIEAYIIYNNSNVYLIQISNPISNSYYITNSMLLSGSHEQIINELSNMTDRASIIYYFDVLSGISYQIPKQNLSINNNHISSFETIGVIEDINETYATIGKYEWNGNEIIHIQKYISVSQIQTQPAQ